jgi:outer membrane murein-binding lipoprotein Lpp
MEVNIVAILGLLLVLAVGGLAVDVVVQNTSSISVDAMGQTFSLSPGWLFVAGVAAGVIALLGVSMLVAGMTRARRRRSALVDTRSSVQDLQAERDRLAVELERERSARKTAKSAEIDLADERHPEPASRDYDADRREPVESGPRRGLFHRSR